MYNLYFENVLDIGNLYLRHIFLEFESEPILFLCSDSKDHLYFCLCSDIRFEQKWIIVKTNIDNLIQLVEKKIDILKMFSLQNQVIVAVMDLNGNEKYSYVLAENIDPLDLPEKNVLLKCNQEHFFVFLDNFIYLNRMNKINYSIFTYINAIISKKSHMADYKYNDGLINKKNNYIFSDNSSLYLKNDLVSMKQDMNYIYENFDLEKEYSYERK